jgi:hypothetical protein
MEINANQIATQRVLEPGAGHLEAAAAKQERTPAERRPEATRQEQLPAERRPEATKQERIPAERRPEEQRRRREAALESNLTLEAKRGLGTKVNTVA